MTWYPKSNTIWGDLSDYRERFGSLRADVFDISHNKLEDYQDFPTTPTRSNYGQLPVLTQRQRGNVTMRSASTVSIRTLPSFEVHIPTS